MTPSFFSDPFERAARFRREAEAARADGRLDVYENFSRVAAALEALHQRNVIESAAEERRQQVYPAVELAIAEVGVTLSEQDEAGC